MSQTQAPSQSQKKADFATRFFKIFNTHVFGAAKQAQLPATPHGFVYFVTEPLKTDASGKVLRYKSPHLGRALVLTPEQERHIAEYLGVSVEDLIGKKPQQ